MRLTELFVPHLDPVLQPTVRAWPDLEPRLADALARGRTAWPGIDLPPDAFLPYVAARVPPHLDADAIFATLQMTDLYLACAGSRGDPAAIAAFEARFRPDVEAALDRLRATRDQRQEVTQALWAQLFTGTPGAGPAILTYSGRGALAGWLRVAAVRAGFRLLRREERAGVGHDDLLTELPSPDQGPELEYLKTKYCGEFQDAFAAALDGLSAQQRILLRLHYVDGLSIDAIGEVYRLHRATVARRIAKARHEVLTSTRRTMVRRLRLPREEQESVLRLIRSQLQVSLTGHLPQVDLGEHEPPPE